MLRENNSVDYQGICAQMPRKQFPKHWSSRGLKFGSDVLKAVTELYFSLNDIREYRSTI